MTADQAVRGGKLIDLKKTVDDAVKQCPDVKRVFVATRTGNKVPMSKIDIPLEEVCNILGSRYNKGLAKLPLYNRNLVKRGEQNKKTL